MEPSRAAGKRARREEGTQDGRLLRSERARAAVADALLALIEDGNLKPTAPQIAERAGVSLRLVFHHFRDLDDLFITAAERHISRVLPTLHPAPTTGPLPERLEAFVLERTRLLERIMPVRRAAVLLEPFSKAASELLRKIRHLKRSEVSAVFETELEATSAGERAELFAALAAAASFSAWDALRVHQELAPDVARAALGRTISALLAEFLPSRKGKRSR